MVDRTEELKARVEAKKKELEQSLTQMKADAHGAKNDKIDELEQKLQELNSAIKDGWENLTNEAVERLNRWLR